ncbi:MAG: bacteriorhodopsin [Halobacteriaceae archaeon]
MIHDITATYAIGTAALALGTVVLLVTGWNAFEDKRYPGLLAGITGVAAVAYAAMTLGVGVVSVGERTVFVVRYADWLVTTPLQLAFLALVANVASNRTAGLLAVDVVMIAGGVAATLLTVPSRFLLAGVSTVAFVVVLWQLYGPLTAAADGRSLRVGGYYRKLRNIVGVLWFIYPLVWATGPAGLGLMTAATTAVVIVYLDVISKVGFGLVAVNSSAVLLGDGTPADEPAADAGAAPADD